MPWQPDESNIMKYREDYSKSIENDFINLEINQEFREDKENICSNTLQEKTHLLKGEISTLDHEINELQASLQWAIQRRRSKSKY